MRDINSLSRGDALSQTGATYYNAQLGPPDKGRENKELVVYWMLLNLIPWVFGQKRIDF